MLSLTHPSSVPISATTCAVGLASALLTLWAFRRRVKRRYLPPGPSRLPLVGHLLHVPRELQWERYHDLCKTIGSDVIALDVLGTTIVVLDSAEAVNDLLEHRSHLYSNRPRLPMICELMGWEFNIGLMPYGDRWRSHRKMFHQSFQASAVTAFHPQELKAVEILLQNLETSPSNFLSHFRLMAGYVVLAVAYGIEPTGDDDPNIRISEAAIHYLVEAAVPGAFLVDLIPAMKYIPEWMPFAHFKTFARTSRSHIDKMRRIPYEQAKIIGDQSSFVQSRLDQMGPDDDPKVYEETVMNTASAMFVGGFDTIIAAMTGFVFAMMTHPDVQKKAQAELDGVLSPGQVPTFENRPRLPYLSALLKEVLRWKPITPMAHVVDVDDVYRGYTIPAGSLVLGNAWTIFNDENLYPEPSRFNPDRFLDDGPGGKSCPDPDIAFGFGRRICPGRLMAQDTLWLAMASVLSAFEVTEPLGDDGKPLKQKYEPTSSALVL